MALPSVERIVRVISPLLIPGLLLAILLWNLADKALEPADSLQVLPQSTQVEAASLGSEEDPADSTQDSPEAPTDEAEETSVLKATESAVVAVSVRGQVLHDWKPVAGAAVWVRLVDRANNTYLVGSEPAGQDGMFEVSGTVTGSHPVTPLKLWIDARREASEDAKEEALSGRTTISLEDRLYRHRVRASFWAVFGLPSVFFLSLWIAFLRARPGFGRRLKYLVALVLAFLFTGCMILGVGKGLSSVQDAGGSWEVLSLGYGFLFRGTYVADGTAEWIYSFTSPQIAAVPGESPPIAQGFGAPLWVILLSVIGAAVATVSLLVVATKDPPDTDGDSDEATLNFRLRIEQIVEHQFFILFAPLGAIFVYQLLVAAEGANKAITVAMAALGSGPVLNYLLARAIAQARSIVQPNANVPRE